MQAEKKRTDGVSSTFACSNPSRIIFAWFGQTARSEVNFNLNRVPLPKCCLEVIYRIIDGSSKICFSMGMKAIIKKEKTNTHTSKERGKKNKSQVPRACDPFGQQRTLRSIGVWNFASRACPITNLLLWFKGFWLFRFTRHAASRVGYFFSTIFRSDWVQELNLGNLWVSDMQERMLRKTKHWSKRLHSLIQEHSKLVLLFSNKTQQAEF